MKNIFKILFLAILVPLFLQSCREDEFAFQTAEPSFELYNTTLGSNVLYPTMKDNPFRLSWDNSLGAASEYTVEISTSEDFAKPVVLGKSSTNSFTTSIGNLNDALIQAGFLPYKAQKVYLRVISGSNVSNVISFDATPYPSSAPVITAPTAGTKFVLDPAAPDAKATTVTWTDYSYGTDVTYLVEVSPKGANNWASVGSINNLKMLDVTNKAFNDALIKTGFAPNVAADADIRVTATTKSTGGTITKTSNIVTVNVTPYIAFKDMFLVGDATSSGWSENNNNQAIFRDPVTTSKFYFTGKFIRGQYNTTQFKLLEKIGSWSPQWGLKAGVVADNTGGDPDPFATPDAGYYSFVVDILAKTYSITPATATAASPYTTIGLIGDFTGWGGDLPMEQSTFDPHQWVARDVALPTGQLKFRANSDWGINWGPEKSLQSVSVLSGLGVQGGENILAEEGTYDIFFNDIDGRYQFIKK